MSLGMHCSGMEDIFLHIQAPAGLVETTIGVEEGR